MANLIGLYTGGTTGAKDGNAVSTDRIFSAPVECDINVGESETVIIPIALRAEEGKSASNVTISTDTWDESANTWSGSSNSMVSFSSSSDGGSSVESLKIASVTDSNTVIYMVVTSSDLQEPGIDKNTAITLNYRIAGA